MESFTEGYYQLIQPGEGKQWSSFQYMLLFYTICGFCSAGWLSYQLGYLELFPTYHCIDDGELIYPCSRETICKGRSEPQIVYWVDYSEPENLHNWVQQFDMICLPKS